VWYYLESTASAVRNTPFTTKSPGRTLLVWSLRSDVIFLYFSFNIHLYLLVLFIFLSLFLFFPLHFLCFSFVIFLISIFIPLLLQCPDPQNCLITVLNMLRCVGNAKEPGDKLFCTRIYYYSVYEYSKNIFVSRLIQRYLEMFFNHTGKQGMFQSTFPSKGGT